MRQSLIILIIVIMGSSSCQKFTWNNPYDTATPKSVFTPDGLAVRQEGENLLLSWSQDNNNISGFKLFRSIDRGVSTELVALNKSTLSYTDANVQGGRTYTYTLKAYADKNESNDVSTEIIAKSRPIVNTIAASLVTENTATTGGTIVSDGGSSITTKGLVWSTSVNPTIDLTTKSNDGNGSGAFERILTNLTPNTTYYLRAYATNSVGTAYGNQISFITSKPPAPPILESLTQGLVAYYPFNGNANDESGNGNNGTVNGAALAANRFGNMNQSYTFISNADLISSPWATTFNDFTISLWSKISSGWSYTTLNLFKVGPSNPSTYGGFSLRIDQNDQAYGLAKYKLVGSVSNSGNFLSVLSPSYDLQFLNDWHHYLFVKNGTSLNLYVDNVLVTTLTIPNISIDYSNAVIQIGNQQNLNNNPCGIRTIDDIRIYNRALTQEEITYLANN